MAIDYGTAIVLAYATSSRYNPNLEGITVNLEIEKYEGELRTLREKVQAYESMLHSLHMYRSVTMDGPAINHMLDVICDWSYAHRRGNGEVDNDILVAKAFDRIKNRDWSDSVWNSKVDTKYKQWQREAQEKARLKTS